MTITINGRDIPVPESWNELSLHQILLVYGILSSDSPGLLEPFEILPAKRLMITKALLKLDDAFLRRWEADCIQAAETPEEGREDFTDELYALSTAVTAGFLDSVKDEEDESERYALRLALTRCPYPKLERKKKHYFPAADSLANISIYELGITFTLFESYLETNEEAYVDELIATLYRPSKPKTAKNKRSNYRGDRRLPLLGHESTIGPRQRHMAKLPPAVKQIILFWFASCRQVIIENYAGLFTSSSARPIGRTYGWGEVIMGLAGDLTQLDNVARQSYTNAFDFLAPIPSRLASLGR